MRRDKIYWVYQRQALLEQVQYLTEADRKFYLHNLDYQIANNMAHSGESPDAIHSHLSANQSDKYYQDAYEHWYSHGAESPVSSYLRHVAKIHYGMGDSVRHSEIDGVPVHDSLVTPISRDYMHAVHDVAKEAHAHLPEHITIYRGIGVHPNDVRKPYKPHSLESWTGDIDTARKFSKMSHIENAVPHVYKATIHRDDLLLSHVAGSKIAFIPPEHALVGKQEYIPLGHKLKNIERIE